MAYKNQKEILVGSIPKTDSSTIQAKVIQQKNGGCSIDIREHIESENYSGPLKKGIRFDSENWDNFKALVEKIESALNAL